MRKKTCFFVLLCFCLLAMLFAGTASAIWIGIDSIYIFPEDPSDLDSVTVFIDGEISTPCDSIWYEYHQIQGSRIDLHLKFYDYQGICPQVIDPFCLEIPIGRLSAGLCTLYVIIDSYPNSWCVTFEVTEDTGDPTEVIDSEEDVIGRVALSQNYPNPFNSTTILSYEVKKGEHVGLRIYDILGREVRELVNGAQKEGYYRVAWDGRNNQGKEVTSGIYFYQLRAGDYKQTRKLALIR